MLTRAHVVGLVVGLLGMAGVCLVLRGQDTARMREARQAHEQLQAQYEIQREAYGQLLTQLETRVAEADQGRADAERALAAVRAANRLRRPDTVIQQIGRVDTVLAGQVRDIVEGLEQEVQACSAVLGTCDEQRAAQRTLLEAVQAQLTREEQAHSATSTRLTEALRVRTPARVTLAACGGYGAVWSDGAVRAGPGVLIGVGYRINWPSLF